MTTTYTTANWRLRYRLRRVAQSAFVQDVRAHLPLIPEVIGGVTVGYLIVVAIRALYLIPGVAS